MGCDIHTFVEIKKNGEWQKANIEMPDDYSGTTLEPFDNRSYSMFAVLAGVRNYSGITPIKEPAGIPEDASFAFNTEHGEWASWAHSGTYYTLKELLDFDWDKPCEDRRVARELAPGLISEGCTAEPGQGEMTTYRAMVGDLFHEQLAALKAESDRLALNRDNIRILIYFDN